MNERRRSTKKNNELKPIAFEIHLQHLSLGLSGLLASYFSLFNVLAAQLFSFGQFSMAVNSKRGNIFYPHDAAFLDSLSSKRDYLASKYFPTIFPFISPLLARSFVWYSSMNNDNR